MVDRPGKDASAAEIAVWLENSFWESIAEGIDQEDTDDDDNEQ